MWRLSVVRIQDANMDMIVKITICVDREACEGSRGRLKTVVMATHYPKAKSMR